MLYYFLTLALGLALGALLSSALNGAALALGLDINLAPLALLLGLVTTWRASKEFTIKLPFIRLNYRGEKKLVADKTVLTDPRLLALASSGLIDSALVIPTFVTHELKMEEAKEALDCIKKLEELPHFKLRYSKLDFPEEKESDAKIDLLCRQTNSSRITSNASRIQNAKNGDIRIVDIDALAKALKPLKEGGETMQIKIQRPGKEPLQGVGYLDDGTMVVVNGGGEYIGCTIDVDVLSTKHTQSGRIIFCNAADLHEEALV